MRKWRKEEEECFHRWSSIIFGKIVVVSAAEWTAAFKHVNVHSYLELERVDGKEEPDSNDMTQEIKNLRFFLKSSEVISKDQKKLEIFWNKFFVNFAKSWDILGFVFSFRSSISLFGCPDLLTSGRFPKLIKARPKTSNWHEEWKVFRKNWTQIIEFKELRSCKIPDRIPFGLDSIWVTWVQESVEINDEV